MQLFGITRRSTTVKNPQANTILEHVHGVLDNMMCIHDPDISPTTTDTITTNFIVDATWAIYSTYHTVPNSIPGASIFGRDMLFDIPYIADWNDIGCCRQEQVNKYDTRENLTRLLFDYAVGGKILIRNGEIL